jgi:hypothetical protein
MSNIIVLASAHTTDRNAWAGLRDTCEQHGVPLNVLGTDKPLGYPSNDPRLFLESVPETLAFLRSTDADYIVQTDSFDVLCARWDASTIERLCQEAKGNLLVSCEANCFPDGPWRASYDALCETPWRYPNAGQYCGTRAAVLAFVELLTTEIKRLPLDDPFGGGAQQVLHWMHRENYPMSLDYRCEAFQSLYTGAASYVAPCSGIVLAFNTRCGTAPLFLHFNGRAPGYPEWYRHLTKKQFVASSMRPEYA